MVVVSYNSRQYLERCISALVAQDHSSFEILLVDNGSDDGGPEAVQSLHPEVRVVRMERNLHYTGGNNAGFRLAAGARLASLNVDTEVTPGWLSALERALDEHPDAGLVTARVCLDRQRDRLNTCGNLVHVSGLGFCRGLGQPAGTFTRLEEVPAISGAAFMTRRAVLDAIGLFDEDFYAYVEDTDLSMRARLAGYHVLYVPDAVVYHDYDLRMRPEKFYYLERNRLLPMIKALRWRTLAALLPALALGELMGWTFAATHGPAYLAAKLRGIGWILGNWKPLMARRAEVQRRRGTGDAVLMRWLSWRLPPGQLGVPPRIARPLAAVAGAAFAVASAPARWLVR